MDNTNPALDPYEALLYHLEQVKRIIDDTNAVFSSKDLTAIRRSISAIENKVVKNEEE